MTVGKSLYDGLALAAFGESEIQQQTLATDILTLTGTSSMAADFLVFRDSDGSEVMNVDQRGVMDLTITAGDTSTFGLDVRMTGSATAGWNLGINSAVTLGAATVTNAQNFAIRAYIDATCLTTLGGGRLAGILCNVVADTSASGASRSMIHFDDGDSHINNLFTFGNCDLDNSFFVTMTEAASTHGLRIYHGTTKYYIMVTSCLT